MTGVDIVLSGAGLVARGSGALFWPDRRLLVVADLHLGRSERLARSGGALLPPYEGRETLARLEAEIRATEPAVVICLGDSFDDLAAEAALPETEALWLTRLMAGRRWLWIAGNHDPGPLTLPGEHRAAFELGPLIFRHQASPGATGEVSAHYHPKHRLGLGGRGYWRPCFLVDHARLILPAFGAYTGGMRAADPVLRALMGPTARAILTGTPPLCVPMPR
jgi:DNA ligase-associated metallophosphoesterase